MRSVIILDDPAMIGGNCDAHTGIAPIVDEDVLEQTVRLAFLEPDRKILVDLSEALGLQKIGDLVGGYFGFPPLQPTHAVWCKISGDESHKDCNHTGCTYNGTKQPDGWETGRVHHDNL